MPADFFLIVEAEAVPPILFKNDNAWCCPFSLLRTVALMTLTEGRSALFIDKRRLSP